MVDALTLKDGVEEPITMITGSVAGLLCTVNANATYYDKVDCSIDPATYVDPSTGVK